MAKSEKKKAKVDKPAKPDIRAFFTKPKPAPAAAAGPSSKQHARKTAKPVLLAQEDVKGKRKAITLLDDSDSDLEIIELPAQPRPAKRVAAASATLAAQVKAEPDRVAGPSRIPIRLELEDESDASVSLTEGSGDSGLARRVSTVGAWAVQGPASVSNDRDDAMQVDPPLALEGPVDAHRPPGDEQDDTEPIAIDDDDGAEDVQPSENDDWGDDDEGARSSGGLSEGDWGEDGPAGGDGEGDDGDGWGPDAFDVPLQEPTPEPDSVAEDLSEPAEETSEVVQGSSKDLEPATVAPAASQPVCPVCELALTALPEKKRQLHVNKCLDGPNLAPTSFLFSKSFSTPTTSSSTTTTSTSTKPKALPKVSTPPKPRQPLSTLPALSPQPKPDAQPGPARAGPNAFTALMSVHAEGKQWKEAEKSDNLKGRLPKGTKRSVPFYKWVEGLEITVDAFKYGKIEGCKAYFLSHAHSDHYQNLSASWDGGPIYCSKATANLIKLKLNVKDKWVHALPFDTPTVIQGVTVTLIDANHCPGSALFVFEGPHTCRKSAWSSTPTKIFRYLHCGDFRASPAHVAHPALAGKKVDACYLDTTYLDPKYCFPAQQLVIDACAELVRARVVEGDQAALYRAGPAGQAKQEEMMKGWMQKSTVVSPKKEESGKEVDVEEVKVKVKPRERLLVLVGTYSIGKERIVKGIAQAIDTKIYCDDAKLKLFKAQDDPELDSLITRDPYAAQVHVGYLQSINHESLSDYLTKFKKTDRGFTHIIGLRPTGWTYRPETKADPNPTVAKVLDRERQRMFSPAGMYPQRDSTSTCLAFGVPYSEHSSFFELTCFALSLDCPKWIPTVNVGSEASRKKMQYWFARWGDEKRRRKAAGLRVSVPARAETHW
ncbi:hypothetical protein RQP46_009241 [Phenoliferia psychrophenolica]